MKDRWTGKIAIRARAAAFLESELYDDFFLLEDDPGTYTEYVLGTKVEARQLVYDNGWDIPGHPLAGFFDELFSRVGSLRRDTEVVVTRAPKSP